MASLAKAKDVLPAIAAAMAVSAVGFHMIRNQKVFGGTTATTMTTDWADETLKLSAAKAREGSNQPVTMDPFTHRYPPDFLIDDVRVPGGWSVAADRQVKRSKSGSYIHGYTK